MTSPITSFAPPLSKVGDQEPISGVVSGLQVFNKAAATAQTSPKNPDATDATVANVFIATVPTGSTYLDLMALFLHAAVPSVFPVVRVFGLLPPVQPGGDTPPLPPKNVDQTNFGALPDGTWRPLGALSLAANQYSPTIGSGEFWSDGTRSLSEATTINILGVIKVAVLIDTAATVAGSVCEIVGHFGK